MIKEKFKLDERFEICGVLIIVSLFISILLNMSTAFTVCTIALTLYLIIFVLMIFVWFVRQQPKMELYDDEDINIFLRDCLND